MVKFTSFLNQYITFNHLHTASIYQCIRHETKSEQMARLRCIQVIETKLSILLFSFVIFSYKKLTNTFKNKYCLITVYIPE